MKKKKERLIKKNLENSGSSEPPLNTKIKFPYFPPLLRHSTDAIFQIQPPPLVDE
jgi:hypothetical protein